MRARASWALAGWHDRQVSTSVQGQALWVRMYDWVPVEAGLPDPMPGSVLEGTGLRVRGVLESVDPSAKEGLLLAEGKTSTIARVVEYDVTGHVVKANDFDVDVG